MGPQSKHANTHYPDTNLCCLLVAWQVSCRACNGIGHPGREVRTMSCSCAFPLSRFQWPYWWSPALTTSAQGRDCPLDVGIMALTVCSGRGCIRGGLGAQWAWDLWWGRWRQLGFSLEVSSSLLGLSPPLISWTALMSLSGADHSGISSSFLTSRNIRRRAECAVWMSGLTLELKYVVGNSKLDCQ